MTRVAFFGTYDADAHPRVRVLEQGLRARGVATVECNVPLRVDTMARVAVLRRPWTAPRLLSRVVRAWAALAALAARQRRAGRVDAVVVGYLGHLDVLLARLLFPRRRIALDFLVSGEETAVDRRVDPDSLTVRLLRGLDRIALAAATTPIVDTDARRAALSASARRRALVVPVGAADEWHDVAPAPEGAPLTVIFYGLFTPLHGTPTIARSISLLEARDDIAFTLVGGGQDAPRAADALAPGARVRWLRWCPPGELPGLVARHHVCLGIFGAGGKARRVVPNKAYQGAAAGCAIVTSDTPPQREALQDGALYVPPQDPTALAEALARLAEQPELLREVRRAALARARTAFRPAAVAEPLHGWVAA